MMKYIFFSCLMLCLSVGKAQVEFAHLQDLLDYADEHAAAIQTARVGEELAELAKKDAKSFLFPSVSASAGYNDNITLQPSLVPAQFINPMAPEGAFEELTFGVKYNYSIGGQAKWDIVNFQRIFAMETANIQVAENKLQTESKRYAIYNSLASTYYSIVLTQEALDLYAQNLKTAESIYQLALDKYEKGLLSEADLNIAKINKLQNEQLLTLATNNLAQYYVQLQSQLNTKDSVKVLNADRQTLEDAPAFAPHIDIRLQETVVAKYESILKQKKALYYPTLSFVYQFNNVWATDQFFAFGDANSLPQQLFGVQLNVPIFMGFSRYHGVQQSRLELKLQRLQLDNLRLQKAQEDQLLQLQLQQAQQRLSSNQEILTLHQQNDQHAENKYQAGLMSLDERLRKYNDLLNAQDSYLQSRANLSLIQYKLYIRQLNFDINEN